MTHYVTMTDKFMSGWGQAKGKRNKLVLTCETLAEAEIVRANAERRSEMTHINIRDTRPSYPGALISWHDKSDYPTWYKPNSF